MNTTEQDLFEYRLGGILDNAKFFAPDDALAIMVFQLLGHGRYVRNRQGVEICAAHVNGEPMMHLMGGKRLADFLTRKDEIVAALQSFTIEGPQLASCNVANLARELAADIEGKPRFQALVESLGGTVNKLVEKFYDHAKPSESQSPDTPQEETP